MDSILSYSRKEEDDCYFILGCDELSTEDQIIAEYKVRAMECHPDKHPDDPSAVAKFARLQQAKAVLCDNESRKSYDQWRRSGVAISYEEWCARKNIRTSLHWASKSKKEPMIEAAKTKPAQTEDHHIGLGDPWMQRPGWTREQGAGALDMFRKYEI